MNFQPAIFNWLEAESLSHTSGPCFSGSEGKQVRREEELSFFFFFLAKFPTVLSLNSKDLCKCLVQGGAQDRPLTRADTAARGTWFD